MNRVTVKNASELRDPIGNERTWIGDFPPPDRPHVGLPWDIIPGHGLEFPYPRTTSIRTAIFTGSAWRVVHNQDSSTASIDMPGVRNVDLHVEFVNGTLFVNAKRADTGATLSETCTIGVNFDPQTAAAVLELGVLSITVSKLKQAVTTKVPVTSK